MNTFICSHYIFMDYPIEQLKAWGFDITKELNISENQEMQKLDPQLGFESRLFSIISKNGLNSHTQNSSVVILDYREVFDEDEFVKKNKNKGGSLRELLKPTLKIQNPKINQNEVVEFRGIQFEFIKNDFLDLEVLKSAHTELELGGFYLDLSGGEQVDFAHHLSQSGLTQEELTQFHMASPQDPQYNFFHKRKDFSLWAIVFKTKSRNYFESLKKEIQSDSSLIQGEILTWKGANGELILDGALVLKNHITQWDIVFVL